MKKVIILVIAMLLLFSSCTDVLKETAAPKEETSKEIKEEAPSSTGNTAPETKSEEESEPPSEPLPMAVAVVVARDSYASSELNPVLDALEVAGYIPIIMSDELGQANGGEEEVSVQHVFKDLSAEDLRGVVLIGGSDSLWVNAELHSLLIDCRDNGRVTAAICLASVTLAKAGVIGEGDTACWFNCDVADPEMQAAGVKDSGQPVTDDGLIVTGDGPESAEEFAKTVVEALEGM